MEIFSVLVNFLCSDDKRETENYKKWKSWFITAASEFEKRGAIVRLYILRKGMRVIDREKGKEIVIIDLSSKGKVVNAILNSVKAASSKDSEQYSDYIIYTDGDGDIDYELVPSMIDVLKNNNEASFACRKGDLGMGYPRNDIERFENYLLENKYSISLPDGQCGCWGFSRGLFEGEKELKAQGFEIELEILSRVLEKGIIPTFIPTKLASEEGKDRLSEFTERTSIECRRKLEFIIEELKLTKNLLISLYKNFLVEYPEFKLPEQYVSIIQTVAGSPLERKLPKCSIKETCYRCDIKSAHN